MNVIKESSSCSWRLWFSVLLAFCVFRVLSLGEVALLDTTEGRYASIGLEMLRQDNWITPSIPLENGWEPFWGKPPLQFWLIAYSCKIFGANEFAARFPSFLAAILLGLITWVFARRVFNDMIARLSVVILASSCLFLQLAGAVTMDMSLAVGTWGGLVAAFYCMEARDRRQSRLAGVVAAVFLAIGVLSKGPIAVIFPGAALLGWVAWERRWSDFWRLPWFVGGLVFLLLSIPWFVIAERATPGFLEYFFVNEHFLRFVSHEYGDKYGSGHSEPHGAVWVMAAIAMLPWTPLFTFLSWKREKGSSDWLWSNTGVRFAILGALVPLLFFTFCRQLTMTYVVPSLPGISVILAVMLERANREPLLQKRVLRWSTGVNVFSLLVAAGTWIAVPLLAADAARSPIGTSVVFIIGGALLWSFRCAVGVEHAVIRSAFFFSMAYFSIVFQLADFLGERRSTRPVLEKIAQLYHHDVPPVTFPYGSPFSAYFYSSVLFPSPIEVSRREPSDLVDGKSKLVVMKKPDLDQLSPEVMAIYKVAGEVGRWVWLVPKEQ